MENATPIYNLSRRTVLPDLRDTVPLTSRTLPCLGTGWSQGPQPATEWDLTIGTPRRWTLASTWGCIFSICLWSHSRGCLDGLQPDRHWGSISWQNFGMINVCSVSLLVYSNLLCSNKNECKGLYAGADARQFKSHLIFTGPIIVPVLQTWKRMGHLNPDTCQITTYDPAGGFETVYCWTPCVTELIFRVSSHFWETC